MTTQKWFSVFLFAGSLLFFGCSKKPATAIAPTNAAAPTNANASANSHESDPNSKSQTSSIIANQEGPIASASESGKEIRVATFNVSLFRKESGALVEDLKDGNSDPAHQLAHIIQTVRPDILLLNEFDYDSNHEAIDLFSKNYLSIGHDAAEPIIYPHFYSNEVNTGVPSGMDLNRDGNVDSGNDCFGYGLHPGQYGMVVFSKYPINRDGTRTFQKLLWKDMKEANLPTDPKTDEPYYSDDVLDIFRLSSKSHWDVLIDVDGEPLHFIVSHPTPPVFDGAEDRNGKRNHDEIRLIADYIANDPGGYIVDDNGTTGGLAPGSHFVIAGDLNADPNDGASYNHAIRQLTEHPLVQSKPIPASKGSEAQATDGANASHAGDPKYDTADFNDRRTGNLRADYVLPSKTLKIQDAGVFWPSEDDPEYKLVTVTDHRLVWIDIKFSP